MDSGEIFRVVSSRLSSSSRWRDTGREVFSKSFQEEDDEEALKWAAIEKLPTYLRIRRGLLSDEEGQPREIDIKNLGVLERKHLLERLVTVAEEDNEKFLLKLKERVDRVGIDLPTIEVRFEHLSVDAEAYVGSKALPTIFNFFANMLQEFLNHLHILPSTKKAFSVLHDVSGIIKPGRMTLLLGPPSSGKTTFLLALAGKLGSDLKVSGRVTYNGHDMDEFVPQRTSAYISQNDLHLGEMTVRETLAFSGRCQGTGSRYDMLAELARREKEANIKPDPDIDIYMKASSLQGQKDSVVTDYILKILGLEVCADTPVGDDMLRGISGGQKKRVTIGEILVGPVTSRKDQEQYWIRKDEAYRFVKHYLVLIFVNQMASALFRLIGALGRNIVVASALSAFTFLAVLVLGGFVLSRDNINKFWRWGYWLSPMMYGQNAIAVNEFLGNSWGHVPPFTTETLGIITLKSRGLFPEAYWYWLGVGVLFGYVLLLNFLCSLALAYLNPFGKPQANLSEETLAVKNACKTGEFIELPSGGKSSLALMGVTGAGKTTLMDVLAGRKTRGYIEGSITISGYPKNQETFTRIAAYCEQNDIHSPHVTVYESLQYSAWLRLPPEVNSATRKMFIEEIMELVELTPLRQALVGLPAVNGLSTEQRKRLTIAVELVANPSIIFMDEPTSGLDARAAAVVMRTVRNTVDTGRTVVCTIHQPSIDIFDAFDELFLLNRGGVEIYVGPLGHHSCNLIEYFEGINGISKIKDGYNPATWMLEVTSAGQQTALGVNFAEEYKKSELYRYRLIL
ncbi:pleiotropic drug resistance 12 [Actinidia rufa]|uniref:Pleiotropic drug resistance 12 n=1 Tax=Actinidia rufa TaxID=165716 RepID=A0A7J0GC87_9ERIC|nr:pleiotropic drug resistance 12 [Actinidia rufa]